jgi:hypothetical protein
VVQLQPAVRPPPGPLSLPFYLRSDSSPRQRLNERLPAAVGDGVARHGLSLRSCYAEVLGREPEYTSCHDAFL